MQYGIGYIDMYDYGSSWSGPEFSSSEDALSHAKKVLDDFLQGEFIIGMTATALYERFVMFGEDVVIASMDGAPELHFSGQDHVRRRCEEMCGEAGRDTTSSTAKPRTVVPVDCLTFPSGHRMTRAELRAARAKLPPTQTLGSPHHPDSAWDESDR